MTTLKNKEVSTSLEIKQAIKEGYKYALQMNDPSDIWVSQEMNDEDITEIYANYLYEWNPNADPEFHKHMGCPISEAIEWFEIK